MKVAIRGGHSLDIRGANGVVDEVTEDRKITAKVIEYLKLDGQIVLDVTPINSGTSAQDLSIPVNKANSWGADYFVSIHLNAGGGKGSEVLYKSSKGKEYADRIVSKLASLGFTNRGSKADTRGLYEFNYLVAPNNIIEVLFCDSQIDVDLYKKLGIDVIAKAIAEGIIGKEITNQQTNNNANIKEEKKVKNLVVYGNSIDRRAAEYLADYLQCPTFDGSIPFDYSVVENVYCVGGTPTTNGITSWTGYAKKIITGTDRFDTIIQVLKFIGRL